MRFFRLLLFLIPTQWYSDHVAANANSIQDMAYDSRTLQPSHFASSISSIDQWNSKNGKSPHIRRIRDLPYIPTEEQLREYSEEDFQKGLSAAKWNRNVEQEEMNNTEIKLTNARSEANAAITAYESAKLKGEAASKKKQELENPEDPLAAEVTKQKTAVKKEAKAVTTAEKLAPIPAEEKDKKQFAIDQLTTIHKLAQPFDSAERIAQIEENSQRLDDAQTEAEEAQLKKLGELTAFQTSSHALGCHKPGSSNRTDCINKQESISAARAALVPLNATLEAATTAARRAGAELQLHKYLLAVDLLERAEADLRAAEQRKSVVDGDLNKAITDAEDSRQSMVAANATYAKKQLEIAKLQAAKEGIQEQLTARDTILQRYLAAAEWRQNPPVEAGIPWGIIGGAVGGSILAAVLIVGLIVGIRKLKKKKPKAKKRAAQKPDDGDDSDGSNEGAKGGKKEKVKSDKTKNSKSENTEKTKSGEAENSKPEKQEEQVKSDKKEEQNKSEKKNEKEELASALSRNACIEISGGKMVIDGKNFEYKHLLQYDAYAGDLPHDKANEKPGKIPEEYNIDKTRLRFTDYGLEKVQVTGNKTPIEIVDPTGKANPKVGKSYVPSDFFQPKYLRNVTNETLIEFFKSNRDMYETTKPKGDGPYQIKNRNTRCVHKPEKYISTLNGWLHKRNPSLYPAMSNVKLDKADVRRELVEFLHIMAAAPSKDNDPTSRFRLYGTHIMWICSNALEVIAEQHTSQLYEFSGSVIIVGDIHGQFPDLLRMFALNATSEKPGWLTQNYLFLGDYVDRGAFSMETVMFLFLLKTLYPKHITLLRGNHEDMIYNFQYGFNTELHERYQEFEVYPPFNALWRIVNDVFFHLPFASLINSNVFCVHGGIGPQLKKNGKKSLREIFKKIPIPYTALITLNDPDSKISEEIHDLVYCLTWNDIIAKFLRYVRNDTRGGCLRFGLQAFEEFQKEFGIKLMFRAHELCPNGMFFPFLGVFMVISLFGAPYYDRKRGKKGNNRAAYVHLDIDGTIGVHIVGHSDTVKTEDEAMEIFRKCHALEKNMGGDDVVDDTTLRIVFNKKKAEGSVENKKTVENPADEDKTQEEKVTEELVEKTAREDSKMEEKVAELVEKTAIEG